MSTRSMVKAKSSGRATKLVTDHTTNPLDAAAQKASTSLAPVAQPLLPPKTSKPKAHVKKTTAAEGEPSASDLLEGMATTTTSETSGNTPLIYAQSDNIVSDVSGSSNTPNDLTPPVGDNAEAYSATEHLGLSAAQMMALGVLGAFTAGGIVAFASSNNSSSNSTPANNSNAISNNPTIPPADTSAPQIQHFVANGNVITLTYSEALDPNHPPAISAFKVTTGGVTNAITAISISSNTLNLTLTSAITPGDIVSLAYNDLTTDNDQNAIQDLAGNDATGFVQGVVADGYISGAKIYIDANADGIAQESEFTGVTTNADGTFFLPNTLPNGTIIAVGGINIDTGLEQLIPLKAPAGSTTINPLSTVLVAYLGLYPNTSIEAASAAIASSLGFVIPDELDLGVYNPLAGTNEQRLDAQKVAAQIATLLNTAAGDDDILADALISELAANLGTPQNITPFNLSGSSDISNVLDVVLHGTALQDSTTQIRTANLEIDAVVNIGDISAIQSDLGLARVLSQPNTQSFSQYGSPPTSLSINTNFDYSEALTASLFSDAAYSHRTKNAISTFLARTDWQALGQTTQLEVSNAYDLAAKRTNANGSIEYIIAYEGSNSPFDSVQIKDWTYANASEYGWSDYYANLMPLMTQLLTDALAQIRAGKDVEISITGHSLGGAAAAMAYADLYVPYGQNLWVENHAPLTAGRRIYDQFNTQDQADIRSLLLPTIDTYTFGAPSILIEPTKLNGIEWLNFAGTIAAAGAQDGLFAAAVSFLSGATKVVTVNSALLPDLTSYWEHVFQFEHKNSTAGTWNDIVASIGNQDAGTVIGLDLASDIYARYGGSWSNPIATHSIAYYGESVARLIENEALTKSGGQLLDSSSPTSGNDFILNGAGIDAFGGNDDFVFTTAGNYTATGNLGDDAYTITSYGTNLSIDGNSGDGSDSIYFALAGIISAQDIGSNAMKFTITNGNSNASVTVNHWSNHYVNQVAQIVETSNPWRINYFDLSDIGTPRQELNGLTYSTDGFGQPFILALPNADSPGSKISVPTPIIGAVTGEVSFMVNGAFDPTLQTFVYTHGWTDNARVDISGSIKAKLIYDAYTSVYGTGEIGSPSKTANIVMANWESLAASRDPNEPTSEPSYESSITKQVGEVVADALLRSGADINQTTLIGHSLGSFVVGSAANEIILRTGMKVKELVALDTAATNPLFPEYDIDARNGYDRSLIWGSSDTPYDFTDAIAQHTTSYTVIDNTLTGGLSGNNDRASTADSAYLVAYVPTDVPFLSMKATSPYHNGVVAAYADLVIKGDLNPVDANTALGSLKFNDDGQAVSNGIWDGVLAVNQPWLTSTQLNADGNYIYNPPKSIGWISNIDNPTIYGSSAADVMFFDEFKTDTRVGATLIGGAGDDWLGGSTGQGIDHFFGDGGQDTFYFGFIKNTNTVLPYLDGSSWLTDYGTDAFGIVEDFDSGDQISFGWNQMTLTDGADYDTSYFLGDKLSNLYGAGVAFSVDHDLVAYIKGMTMTQAQAEITAHDILFGSYANLDQTMFFTIPAPITMPTAVPVVI